MGSEKPEDPEREELDRIKTTESYTFQGQRGWRKWRLLRPGRGMYHDVKRRMPYYRSDITDAFTYRAFASTVRMYFVNVLPAIAFTLDMYRRTGQFFGINEALFSSALAAMVFSLLSCQPLTIVGVTGLIALFNYTIYDIVTIYDAKIYPAFTAWVGIWAAIFHWIVAFGNFSDYMAYVTDFSSETFGMYVGIIYCIKGVEELVYLFEPTTTAGGYLSIVIAILYFGSVYGLEKLGTSTLWKPWIRGILADYSFALPTFFWVGFYWFPGRLANTEIYRVPIVGAFTPTQPRNWVIEFWKLDVKWVFVAVPFGFLMMLLFYYDHNVSSLTAQARRFPLKKPAGFHWDFFLLGCTCFVGGILGLPLPNGLVPQAPVHTDSLTIYETRLEITETKDGGQIRKPVVDATVVVEQRVSHFLMGMAIWGTMTGPLLTVLHVMPAAVFAGVFFVVGWGSIESNGILAKFWYLMSEKRFIERDNPLNTVSQKKVWLFFGIQVFGVACTVAISQTIAAIGFPVLIIALIPLRTLLMPKWFTEHELNILDDLTATNPAVLVSFGGMPAGMKKVKEKGVDDLRRMECASAGSQSSGDPSAVRERVGNPTR
ncbi:anion exchange family protein [Ampelomyces quisqualis]|uniref:Anion exchange family protein n=1 Tax=Ampelomyces quisqualis TaxID=50730 RepID=A0A6A5QU77_AMPQU|nr:anion exchange family protein [Ampelomyces quisqualis]